MCTFCTCLCRKVHKSRLNSAQVGRVVKYGISSSFMREMHRFARLRIHVNQLFLNKAFDRVRDHPPGQARFSDKLTIGETISLFPSSSSFINPTIRLTEYNKQDLKLCAG